MYVSIIKRGSTHIDEIEVIESVDEYDKYFEAHSVLPYVWVVVSSYIPIYREMRSILNLLIVNSSIAITYGIENMFLGVFYINKMKKKVIDREDICFVESKLKQ